MTEDISRKQEEIEELKNQINAQKSSITKYKTQLIEIKKEKDRVVAQLKWTMGFAGAYAIIATIVAGYFFVKYKMHAGMLKHVLRTYVPGFIYMYQ